LARVCGTPGSGEPTCCRSSSLEIGFAWSDPDAAIADAKSRIDHFNLKQYVTAGQQAGPQIAA
jgi:hypothetical protein